MERGIAELEAAVGRMETAHHAMAAKARKALKNIKDAKDGKRPGPPGTQGPAESRLRVGPANPGGPPWKAGTDAVTTEERRSDGGGGGGIRVEGGIEVMGGSESVLVNPNHVDGDEGGEPSGYDDACMGGVYAHEGTRLEHVYSRDTKDTSDAERKQSLKNTNAALELNKAVLENIANSKGEQLKNRLLRRVAIIQASIDANTAEINRLGG